MLERLTACPAGGTSACGAARQESAVLDGSAIRREPGANSGGDYRWFGKTRLYIAKGKFERIVRVQTHDDSIEEINEELTLRISNARRINFWVNGAGHTADGIPLDPKATDRWPGRNAGGSRSCC